MAASRNTAFFLIELLPLFVNLAMQPSEVVNIVSPEYLGLANGKKRSLLKFSTKLVVSVSSDNREYSKLPNFELEYVIGNMLLLK